MYKRGCKVFDYMESGAADRIYYTVSMFIVIY